jgi:hypothetical protein
MRRHPLDGVSLLFGALFALVGLAFAVSPTSVTAANLGWIVPIPLIAVGLVVVVASARHGMADRRAYAPPVPAPTEARAWSEPAGSEGPDGDPLGSPPPLREE